MSQVHEKLAAIMADAKSIGKDSKNTSQGFKFRGIDAVMNHLHPVFAKHGVVILPEVLEERSEDRETRSGGNLIYRILRIKFTFAAADGSTASCVVVGEGMDSGDKASNKAMAVGLKYALTQVLLLPYDEVDPDSETHAVKGVVSTAVGRPQKASNPSKGGKSTPKASTAPTIDEAARDRTVETFSKLGLGDEALAILSEYAGKPVEGWDGTTLVEFRTAYNKIKSGDKTLQDIFGHLMDEGGE